MVSPYFPECQYYIGLKYLTDKFHLSVKAAANSIAGILSKLLQPIPKTTTYLEPCSTGGPKNLHCVCPYVCLSVHQFGIFLRNRSLVFSDILHGGRKLNYLKSDRALFSEKNIFVQIWAKRTQNDPIIGFFGLFKKFYIRFSCK